MSGEQIKPEYKRTKVGVIPEDWRTVDLNAVCTMKSGEGITSEKIDAFSAYPCYGGNGLRGYTSRYTHDGKFALVGRQGALCGNVISVQGKFYASEHAVVVTPKFGIDINFLTYVLREMRLNRYTESSAQPGLSVSKVLDLSLTLPDNEVEQRSIATALSEVDTLLTKLDQLIAKKLDLKQAAMQDLLTGQTRLPGFSGEWEVKRLGALGSAYGGLTGKIKDDFGRGDAHFIPFMNVLTDTVIDPNWLEQVDVAPGELQNIAKKGDLFFNGSSETPEEVGYCSVLLEDIPDLYLNSFCFGFRFNTGARVDGLFFAYWFRCKQGRKAMAVLAQGATRYNISKSAFLQLEIPQPSTDEQAAIATVLSDLDAELAALEVRREKTHALKQGMMQELLTGRVRLVEGI